MKRYIGVDCGKGNTKTARLNPDFLENKEAVPYFINQFKTAYCKGYFEDDEPGRNTYIVEYEGEVYKVGKAATKEAELVSSKRLFIHKLCTMLAIAKECSEDCVDEVYVAIGIPTKDYSEVMVRNEYREYILPLGEQTVKYRDIDGSIKEKTFNIVSRKVYPESIGGNFVTGVNLTEPVAVIDLGYLNVNMTVYNGLELDPVASITTTKGANYLISGLAQELSSHFGTNVTKAKAADIIVNDRVLKFRNPDPAKEEESRKVIKKFINDYIDSIIEYARSKDWALDVMQLVIVGGEALMIKDDLFEKFGENTFIPDKANMINAIGFLKILCGRSDVLKIKLP